MFGFWIDSFGESRRLIGGAERSQRKADKPGQRPETLIRDLGYDQYSNKRIQDGF